jgi:centrosome and spindle pole-associated protein 1
MMDDESRKKTDRLDDKVNDYHFLDEFYAYNPFGRGGGGAPLRDQFGNMVTSRKPQFRNEYAKNTQYNRGP